MQPLVSKFGMYVAIVALMLAAIIYYLSSNRGPTFRPAARNAFFVDEETGAESVRPVSDIPPLSGATGKETLVGEYKYSIDGGKTTRIAYYYKYTPDVKKKLEATPPGQPPTFDPTMGELVRSPQPGSHWVQIDSDEGQSLTGVRAPAGQTLVIVAP